MSSIVTVVQEYRVPIISAAQGPQGGPGPAGPAGPVGPTGPSGSGAGASTIPDLTDVDLTTLSDGALLVYNASTELWVATNILEKQAVDCGQY